MKIIILSLLRVDIRKKGMEKKNEIRQQEKEKYKFYPSIFCNMKKFIKFKYEHYPHVAHIISQLLHHLKYGLTLLAMNYKEWELNAGSVFF